MLEYCAICGPSLPDDNFTLSIDASGATLNCDLGCCGRFGFDFGVIWKRSLYLRCLYLLNNFGQRFGDNISWFEPTFFREYAQSNPSVHYTSWAYWNTYCNCYSGSRKLSNRRAGPTIVHSWDLGMYCHRSQNSRQLRLSQSLNIHSQ